MEYTDGERTIIVPAGFETDLASVPFVFWAIFPPFGKYSCAAIIHDWLCVNRTMSADSTHWLFREAMKALGVARWRRRLMYRAVKTFGPRW